MCNWPRDCFTREWTNGLRPLCFKFITCNAVLFLTLRRVCSRINGFISENRTCLAIFDFSWALTNGDTSFFKRIYCHFRNVKFIVIPYRSRDHPPYHYASQRRRPFFEYHLAVSETHCFVRHYHREIPRATQIFSFKREEIRRDVASRYCFMFRAFFFVISFLTPCSAALFSCFFFFMF